MAVFAFLYVCIAEVNAGTWGARGLSDTPNELVAIATLAGVASLAGLFYDRIDTTTLFMVVNPLFATAMLLLPVFWGSSVFVSGLMLKCGYVAYIAIAWIVLSENVKGDITSSFFHIGIAMGILELSALIGRYTGFYIHTASSVTGQTLTTISLVTVWIMAMGILAFFIASRRREEILLSRVQEDAVTVAKLSIGLVDDPSQEAFTRRCVVFAERNRLSERETQILIQFAHGRSADYIAKEEFISKETVKTHLKRIHAKAGVHNRQELLDGIDSISIDEFSAEQTSAQENK